MKIDQIIDRDYFIVSVLDEVDQICEKLKERPCYVVVDEGSTVVGLVSLNDLPRKSSGRLIGQDLSKPALSPDSTVGETLFIMQATDNFFLPVYKDQQFVGVISLLSLAEHLFKICSHPDVKLN